MGPTDEVPAGILDTRQLFWVGTLGKFGGEPRSHFHVGLLAAALVDRVAFKNALIGLRKLPRGSALSDHAVNRCYESVLVAIEREFVSGSDPAAPKPFGRGRQIAATLDYLQQLTGGSPEALEALAHQLIQSRLPDDSSQLEAVSILADRGDLGTLLEECSALGLESTFWTEVGQRLVEQPRESLGRWTQWSAEFGIDESYVRFVKERAASGGPSSRDLLVLQGLNAGCAVAAQQGEVAVPRLSVTVTDLLPSGNGDPQAPGERERQTGRPDAVRVRSILDRAQTLGIIVGPTETGRMRSWEPPRAATARTLTRVAGRAGRA